MNSKFPVQLVPSQSIKKRNQFYQTSLKLNFHVISRFYLNFISQAEFFFLTGTKRLFHSMRDYFQPTFCFRRKCEVLKEKAEKDAERRLKKFEERSKKERDKQKKQFKKLEKECDMKIENYDVTVNSNYVK